VFHRTFTYFHNFEERNNISTVIDVEISFNDLICETCVWTGVSSVRVSSLDDILAEKLRSLLQQRTRNRNRSQDVYDIAKYVRQHTLDRDKIGRFLMEKANVREIDVRKSSFDDVIRTMAFEDYDARIREQAPNHFIPFDDAWRDVVSLVQSLNIPD
jgi:predicted nucleotidyltransferase component of viral defense system